MIIQTVKKYLRKGFFDFTINFDPNLERFWGSVRDEKWKYKDQHGHNHQWKGNNITNAKLIIWGERDEDGEEIKCSKWVCKKCGERLSPSSKQTQVFFSKGTIITGTFSAINAPFQNGKIIEINKVVRKLNGRVYLSERETKTTGGGTWSCYQFQAVDKITIVK